MFSSAYLWKLRLKVRGMTASATVLHIQPGAPISKTSFHGFKAWLVRYPSEQKVTSLFWVPFFFFFLNARLVCNTEPIEWIPQNSEHNWAFVFNRWISHMPEGVTRRRDSGRKEEVQFGVEGGGVRGGISNRVTLKRNASYPCKDLFWSAPMSLKLSLSECTEKQAAHGGI